VPVVLIVMDQAQVRFMNQGSGLKGVSGAFAPEFGGRQLAQLLIHNGRKLLQSGFVPATPVAQEDGELGGFDLLHAAVPQQPFS
jgi:hypothetical protein